MTLKDQILDAVAKNLRDFGYPTAAGKEVTSTKLFAMFAKDQVADFATQHADKPDVQAACADILAEIEKTLADG